MMKPAVRVENALALLLRNAAVPARDTAFAISSGVGSPPRTFQTPSTKPSRSLTAITLFGEIRTARLTPWPITRWTSSAVSCARTGEAMASIAATNSTRACIRML